MKSNVETVITNAKKAAQSIALAVAPNEMEFVVADRVYKIKKLASNLAWEFVLSVSEKGAYLPQERVLSYAKKRRGGKFLHGDVNVWVFTAGLSDARRFLHDLPQIVRALKSNPAVDLTTAAAESEKIAQLLAD